MFFWEKPKPRMVKTIEDAERILSDIQYKEGISTVICRGAGDEVGDSVSRMIRTIYTVPDSWGMTDAPTIPGNDSNHLQIQRYDPIPLPMSEDQFLEFVLHHYLNLEDHECRESFQYKGEMIFNPHTTKA